MRTATTSGVLRWSGFALILLLLLAAVSKSLVQSQGASGTHPITGDRVKADDGTSIALFLMDALRNAGLSSDDPAIQRALLFVCRTQNLNEHEIGLSLEAIQDNDAIIETPAQTSVANSSSEHRPTYSECSP